MIIISLFTLTFGHLAASQDLPVKLLVYGQNLGSKIEYYYTLRNNSDRNITSFTLGDSDQLEYELFELPLGWTSYSGLSHEGVPLVDGWNSKVFLQGESKYIGIHWRAIGSDDALKPGAELENFSIIIENRDPAYYQGNAKIYFDKGLPLIIPIELADILPPTFEIALSPRFYRPNDLLNPINVIITSNDDYDPNPVIKLEAITANEPLNDRDIFNADYGEEDREFQLLGYNQKGIKNLKRVYFINYSAEDAVGNSSTKTVELHSIQEIPCTNKGKPSVICND